MSQMCQIFQVAKCFRLTLVGRNASPVSVNLTNAHGERKGTGELEWLVGDILKKNIVVLQMTNVQGRLFNSYHV